MDAYEFERFFAEHERDLYSFCRYVAGINAADAAGDLFQDTVLAAFEMRARIDSSQNPKAFLFSVAVGKWRNSRRKFWRRQTKIPEVPLEASHAEPHAPAESSPESHAQSAFVKTAIRRALAGLNDKFRLPLILHYFDEWGLETIAEICGVPKGTVKSRLFKGRALMKAALEKEGIHEY